MSVGPVGVQGSSFPRVAVAANAACAKKRAAFSNWPTPALETAAEAAPMAAKPETAETPSTGGMPGSPTPSSVRAEATYCSVVRRRRPSDTVDGVNAGQPSLVGAPGPVEPVAPVTPAVPVGAGVPAPPAPL